MLNKKRIFVFILLNGLMGVAIVYIIFLNVFSLTGAAHITVSALAVLGAVFALYLLASWASRKELKIEIGTQKDPASELSLYSMNIKNYLRDNQSTPYFRNTFTQLLERLDTFGTRCENMKGMIIRRFGTTGLSYGKFAAPVAMLQEYLLQLTSGLMTRMQVFNEEEYARRIAEFKQAGRDQEAAEYSQLEKEYTDYAEMTLNAFDQSILKLDKLILEISKLNEGDSERAISIMQELDEVIQDTRLYE